jgi:hypothetical protein
VAESDGEAPSFSSYAASSSLRASPFTSQIISISQTQSLFLQFPP